MASNNLVLIGFMGSGKSTVGRLAAQRSGRIFLDTDTLIESWQGETVSTIFAEQGETAFRDLERRLAAWLEKNVSDAVIATGGGMPFAVENLRNIGEVVLLDVPFPVVCDRICSENESAKRPLFDPDAARTLYEKREAGYKTAADRIVSAGGDAEAVAEELCRSSC